VSAARVREARFDTFYTWRKYAYLDESELRRSMALAGDCPTPDVRVSARREHHGAEHLVRKAAPSISNEC